MIEKNIQETQTLFLNKGEIYKLTNVTVVCNLSNDLIYVSDKEFSDSNWGFPIAHLDSYSSSQPGQLYVRSLVALTATITVTNSMTGVM